MSCWDDEDYFEPSEFDEKIEELKEELRNSVRQEIKDEVERLRKENEELRDIKDNFSVIKADFERSSYGLWGWIIGTKRSVINVIPGETFK